MEDEMSSVTLILMQRIGFKTVLGEKKLLLVDLGLKSDIEMTRVWMFGGVGSIEAKGGGHNLLQLWVIIHHATHDQIGEGRELWPPLPMRTRSPLFSSAHIFLDSHMKRNIRHKNS